MFRPVAIQRYLSVMQQTRGVPGHYLLAGSGIESVDLVRPELLVQPAQSRRVIGNLLKLSQDNGIGFDIWTQARLPDLGILGHATLTSRTIGDNYSNWRRFSNAFIGFTGRFRMAEQTDGCAVFTFDLPDPSDPLNPFFTEELVAVFSMVSRSLIGKAPPIRQASFAYAAPRHDARYQQLLGCPVQFGAAQTQITVDKGWLAQPVDTHDEILNRFCSNHCDSMLRRIGEDGSIASRVREVLARSEGSLPKLELAATTLNMSPRTLRRRLTQEGTSYRAQVDTFRMDRTRYYLAASELSPKELAFRLGFSDPSAFRHAVKAWTGQTIAQYRRQLHEGGSRLPQDA